MTTDARTDKQQLAITTSSTDDNIDSSLDDVDIEKEEQAPPRQQQKSSSRKDDKNDAAPALGFWGAVMILTSFQTSGSIIAIPYAMGQLGYIGGPLAMLLWAALVLMVSFFVCDVALASKERRCVLFADTGFTLDGVRGRRLFHFMQILNLVLYMPLALETIALSAQYLSNYALGNCIGYWNIIMFGLLLLGQQFVSRWDHISYVTYFTVAIAASKAFVFLPYAYTTYESEIKEEGYYLGPAQAFGAPGGTWYDYGLAVATFPYTFCPLFVLIEVMGEMQKPETMKKALSIASAFQLTFYMVGGLTGVALWGWSISDPVTMEIPREGWVGILLSVFVALAVYVDYIIAGKIVSDAFKTSISRFTRFSLDESWKSRLLVTAPPSLFALALVCLVPNFATLVGVVTGFTIISTHTWIVTLAWELGKRTVDASRWALHIASVVGVPLTAWVIAASLYEIATAEYNSDFFCQGT